MLENMWLIWLLTAIFFLLVEAVTTSLVSIWFVPAALISCILSIFVHSLIVQILVFIIFSIIFIFVFRNIYKRKFKKEKNELKIGQSIINKIAITTEKTDHYNGRVLVGDVYWKAKSIDNSIIEPGQKVIIQKIEGTTALVKKG